LTTDHPTMNSISLWILALFSRSSLTLSTENEQEPLDVPPTPCQNDWIDLHKSLVEHASLTGSEHNLSVYLADYLRISGFTVETQLVEQNRENILAYIGDSRKTRVLVTSHIDTVPPFIPYERKGEEIWGRGSSDAKGSVASQIVAVQSLIDAREIGEGDVALLYVVGEEKGGTGMRAANDLGLSWETNIFGEPTELKLVRGHKGGLSLTVQAHGKAGHSGYPEKGRNAIDLLVQGLFALQKVELPGSEEFGNNVIGGEAAQVGKRRIDFRSTTFQIDLRGCTTIQSESESLDTFSSTSTSCSLISATVACLRRCFLEVLSAIALSTSCAILSTS
jgi:acetylornithine deacetylase